MITIPNNLIEKVKNKNEIKYLNIVREYLQKGRFFDKNRVNICFINITDSKKLFISHFVEKKVMN